MNDKVLKIGFIGAGAIGSLFGGYLASARVDTIKKQVVFFARSDHVNTINLKGLIIQKINNELLKIKDIMAFQDYSSYKNLYHSGDSDNFDYLFISTKAYDTLQATKEYKSLIKSSKWIILLQNGIDNEELVKNEVEKGKLVRIVTSHGASLKAPGYVIHTGSGYTKMGLAYAKMHLIDKSEKNADKGSLNYLKGILDKIEIETEIVDDIVRYCWEKAFVNIGINAIGAVTRLKNGQLIMLDFLKKYMVAVVKEGLIVAENEGILFQKGKIVDLMFTVAKETADNENSMLQDIKMGKPTEIDFLNGKIVDIAENLGIDVPFNKLLTDLVKGLEQSYSKKD